MCPTLGLERGLTIREDGATAFGQRGATVGSAPLAGVGLEGRLMGTVPFDLTVILSGLRVGLGELAEVLSALFWGLEAWLLVLVCLYCGWWLVAIPTSAMGYLAGRRRWRRR